MNPALILVHNNIALTKQCVESLRRQDIHVTIFVLDSGSSDDTNRWISSEGNKDIRYLYFPENIGFSRGINEGLQWVFSTKDENGKTPEWCLCPGSDTIMPPSYYRTLLELELPVVSGVQDINGHRVTMEDLTGPFPIYPIRPNPDFSCLLWRKEAWQKLGDLDASMVSYASDCDAHVRAHRMGLGMFHAEIPFFHYGSATLKNAPPKEKRILDLQADADRITFALKWGFSVGSPEYAAQFAPENFGIDAK